MRFESGTNLTAGNGKGVIQEMIGEITCHYIFSSIFLSVFFFSFVFFTHVKTVNGIVFTMQSDDHRLLSLVGWVLGGGGDHAQLLAGRLVFGHLGNLHKFSFLFFGTFDDIPLFLSCISSNNSSSCCCSCSSTKQPPPFFPSLFFGKGGGGS